MRQASLLDVVKTVLAGFVGVRRKSAHEQAKVNPLHVVIVAVAGVALFVATLITIVRIVTH
jgi:hypothetical protein